MKVLMLNGSPRTKGNTFIALEEMKKVFEVEGVEAEIVQVGNKDVRGCIACRRCVEFGKCVFDDVVNELAPKFEEADGIVVASPVYFASANATLIATLRRTKFFHQFFCSFLICLLKILGKIFHCIFIVLSRKLPQIFMQLV